MRKADRFGVVCIGCYTPLQQPILKNVELALYHYIHFLQEQEVIMEHWFVSVETHGSRIYWQVIRAYEDQILEEASGNGAQSRVCSTEVQSTKYNGMRCTMDTVICM